MKINTGQKQEVQTQSATINPNQDKVLVSTRPIRTRVWLDKDGNEIDPKTKQILVPNNEQK